MIPMLCGSNHVPMVYTPCPASRVHGEFLGRIRSLHVSTRTLPGVDYTMTYSSEVQYQLRSQPLQVLDLQESVRYAIVPC